jgi:hypothetical protein
VTERSLQAVAWLGSVLGAVAFTIAFYRELHRDPPDLRRF